MTSSALARYGKHFIVELEGPILSSAEQELLASLQPAGIILFAKNFLGANESTPYRYGHWLRAHRDLLRSAQAAAARERFVVSIDHEGGRVHRPPAPIVRFPYPQAWGARLAEIAEALALQVESLGMNISYSPVLDIHSNPDNPVIGPRAFGTAAAEVCSRAETVADALAARGVMYCGKHFPGHGDVSVDTHEQLAVLPHGLDLLEQRELVPFRYMIGRGMQLVMTAHIQFPALDGERPATCSRAVLTGLLRDRLRYGGAVISDALGMEAVRSRFFEGDGVLEAIKAGCDLFIVAHRCGLREACGLAEKLDRAAAGDGELRAALQQSGARVDSLLGKLRAPEVRELSEEELAQHERLAESV